MTVNVRKKYVTVNWKRTYLARSKDVGMFAIIWDVTASVTLAARAYLSALLRAGALRTQLAKAMGTSRSHVAKALKTGSITCKAALACSSVRPLL